MTALVEKTIQIAMAHRLPMHRGKCSYIHGHTWTLGVRVAGKPSKEDGMVVDFGELSRWLESMAALLDHRILLWERDPLARALETREERHLQMNVFPTSENLGAWLLMQARDKGLKPESVLVMESPTSITRVSELHQVVHIQKPLIE